MRTPAHPLRQEAPPDIPATRLRARRLRLRLSQAQMARVLGVDANTLAQYERGAIPGSRQLAASQRVLGQLTDAQLLALVGEAPQGRAANKAHTSSIARAPRLIDYCVCINYRGICLIRAKPKARHAAARDTLRRMGIPLPREGQEGIQVIPRSKASQRQWSAAQQAEKCSKEGTSPLFSP